MAHIRTRVRHPVAVMVGALLALKNQLTDGPARCEASLEATHLLLTVSVHH